MRGRAAPRRLGDAISISGAYQHLALTSGFGPQRFWHRAKLLAVDKFLPPAPGEFVLDVGCGSGVVSAHLGRFGARVLGLDSNDEALVYAREHFSSDTVSFARAEADSALPVERAVDKIYCLEVIEHVYYEQGRAMLLEFYRALRPGGRVFITTPNYRSLWPLIEWAMDRSGLVPPMACHQHVHHYNRKSLAHLARQCGFRPVRTATMCLLSPWTSVFGRRIAERTFALETSLGFLPGPIVVMVLERP